MLHEVDILELRNIAGLALDARRVRDRLLEEIPDADLGEPRPARGQHNPAGRVELNGVLARTPEFVALREAIVALPRDIREKAWAATQTGRGDFTILDWTGAVDAASKLADEDIVADLLGEPDLHDLLHKGLYELGAATPPGDTT
jgi:hypothetical protein